MEKLNKKMVYSQLECQITLILLIYYIIDQNNTLMIILLDLQDHILSLKVKILFNN